MENSERKNILLARTDRLGDLILTTPAIKAVRDAYPDAHIAMVIRPYTAAVLKNNPYIDEVIVYDKYGRHRSPIASLLFALRLKKKGFDRAIIFHPTNRMHIISYIAGIPRRIGYEGKLSFLLTDRIKNTKHEGKKHERDYTIELLRPLGIDSHEKELYVAVTDKTAKYIDGLLSSKGVTGKKMVVLHPGASCGSKIWPSERFAKLADMLIGSRNAEAIIVGGNDERDIFCAESVKRFMRREALSLAGELDILQLAALLKRAALFISNDSGPVHVAAAVGTPVVDIFGRNEPGLGPVRWGPLGSKDIAIHKDVGCAGICLAHNCKRGFDCLRAISVDDVYSVIAQMKIL